MTRDEQAKIILQSLNRYIQVDWNAEKYYLKGIIEGLKDISVKESK
jgi:hypothetical protein